MNRTNIFIVLAVVFFGVIFDSYVRRVISLEEQLRQLRRQYFVLKKDTKEKDMQQVFVLSGFRDDLVRTKSRMQPLFNAASRLASLESVLDKSNVKIPSFVEVPFAHYRANETQGAPLVDSGIGHHDVLLGNNSEMLNGQGIIGSGLKFEGPGSCVNIDQLADSIAFDSSGTWCLWVKPKSVGRGQILGVGQAGADNYFVIEAGEKGICYFGFPGSKNIPGWHAQVKIFSDNEWVHLAITQDGKEPRIYRNGQLQNFSYLANNGDKTAWYAAYTPFNYGRIGCHLQQNQDGTVHEAALFDGFVDDIRYYKRPLSETEIKALYNDGKGTEDATVVYGQEAQVLQGAQTAEDK